MKFELRTVELRLQALILTPEVFFCKEKAPATDGLIDRAFGLVTSAWSTYSAPEVIFGDIYRRNNGDNYQNVLVLDEFSFLKADGFQAEVPLNETYGFSPS